MSKRRKKSSRSSRRTFSSSVVLVVLGVVLCGCGTAPRAPREAGRASGATTVVGCGDVLRDPLNCGHCGTVCRDPVGGWAACFKGLCDVTCSREGDVACGADLLGGGACYDLSSDARHCGTCGETICSACRGGVCDGGPACRGGRGPVQAPPVDCRAHTGREVRRAILTSRRRRRS